jgi:hypothetical protein
MQKTGNMDKYLIFILIIGLILIINVSNYILMLYKVSKGKQEIIKFKRTKPVDFFNFCIGLFLIGLSLSAKMVNGNNYQFVFLLIAGVVFLINGLIQLGEYVILNTKGIKDSKLRKWDSIKKIRRNEYNQTEIIFDINNKKVSIDFYKEEKIDELKMITKRFSPVTYNLYMAEL